ncbi:MAG TPA: hypothetical protein DEP84_02555 [Chloroflexi bacterium]|nr:hypothetical protein [Chloroflexota bacterium]
MYRNNELMFPHSAIPALRGVRNGAWLELTEHIEQLDEANEESLAFTLMMVRLCGCLNCQPGSYKLSLGCDTCASRAVTSFKGSDSALLRRFRKAKEEVEAFLASHEASNAA